MYSVGELIMYGGTGVCRVEEIETSRLRFDAPERTYYVLKPLYQAGTIKIPVDTQVFMRPLISRDEANELIDRMPEVEAKPYHDRNFTQLAAYYEKCLSSHDCEDVVTLLISIYEKKRAAESQRRKFGQVDARFMKRAESLLYGELAVALDIPVDSVQEYIRNRIEGN